MESSTQGQSNGSQDRQQQYNERGNNVSETREIYAALARVMAKVGVVGKTRKNPQQGYQFRGIDDVIAHCQEVMAEEVVVCVPFVQSAERETVATKSGGTMASVRLTVDHSFFARDGSSVVCRTVGEAMDSGDKASNKAMSAALKYALTETLLIPTYEADRDTEEHSPELAPKAPPVAQSKPPARTAVVDGRPAQAAARAAVAAARTPRPSPSVVAPEPPPPTDADYAGVPQ